MRSVARLYCPRCRLMVSHDLESQKGTVSSWRCRRCSALLTLTIPNPSGFQKTKNGLWESVKDETWNMVAGFFLLFAFVIWTRSWHR